MAIIDASVLVAFFHERDIHHAAARQILADLIETGKSFRAPSIILPEVVGVIRRRTGSALSASGVLVNLITFQFELLNVDLTLAAQAADISARLGVRGADAIYIAAAKALKDELITFDEQRKSAAANEL